MRSFLEASPKCKSILWRARHEDLIVNNENCFFDLLLLRPSMHQPLRLVSNLSEVCLEAQNIDIFLPSSLPLKALHLWAHYNGEGGCLALESNDMMWLSGRVADTSFSMRLSRALVSLTSLWAYSPWQTFAEDGKSLQPYIFHAFWRHLGVWHVTYVEVQL
jgi:hypothetical protein